MNDREKNNILLVHPYCGRITKCTDRGFGFINGPNGEEWIHIHDHVGKKLKTMEGLEERYCSFVIGGHPFRYGKSKSDWKRSVVQWQLLDELKLPVDPANYKEERSKRLQSLDKKSLNTLLAADWYVQHWRKKANEAPKATLKADSQLDEALQTHLAESRGINDLICLLAAISNSPWYGCGESDRESICKRFFLPEKWPPSVFSTTESRSPCAGYDYIWSLYGDLLDEYIKKTRTIAIDLESDGNVIFQFGWKNAQGKFLRKNKEGLGTEELNTALHDCLNGQTSPIIVGHNLLLWDWPILQKKGVELPQKSSFWDTLIGSWLLEPWKQSHALIVKKNAHQADADAQECHKLFEKQQKLFSTCFNRNNLDIHLLVDPLFEVPEQLSAINGRNYPDDIHKKKPLEILFPESRKHDFAWQKDCHTELIAPENLLADPILMPETCRQVAQQVSTLQAKVVSIVVSDAAANMVEVRLSFLPGWLVDDELRSVLREANVHSTQSVASHARTLYLAEDLFKLEYTEIEKRLTKDSLSVAYPNEVAIIWQRMRRMKLSEKQVREKYLSAAENRTGRALLPVQDDDGNKQWLLFEPPGLAAHEASWSIFPKLPDFVGSASDVIKKTNHPDDIIKIARWRDGEARRLDVDRLFVSPDTANRQLFISEITHCILNVLRDPQNKFILLGMRWPEEAEILQRNLTYLGVSTQHPGSPLRQLERTKQEGHRIIACDLANIHKYVHAAERLDFVPLIAVSEVPLHDWYALSHEPMLPEDNPDADGTKVIIYYGTEDDEHIIDDFNGFEPPLEEVPIKTSNIQEAVSRYLNDWVQELASSLPEAKPGVLILDTRLTNPKISKAAGILQHDVPFFSIEEILDTEAQRIYYDVCFPRIEVDSAPKDYEKYRLFLKENWGYEDFRDGTQRPAIEKLIHTDRDILVRLPTGAGKSIIFHLPALLHSHYSKRLTVVITPLRALMRDQVEGLWRRHFTESVDYLSGGRDPWLNNEVYQGILDGRIKLLFVAPERFRVPRFVEALERRRRMDAGLEFLVFDETHCVSEWGFDFRPDYLYAAKYVAEWFKIKDMPGNPHRLLLTSATVTQRNRVDLEKELNLGSSDTYENLPEEMPHPIQPFINLESFDLNEDEEAPSDEKLEKIIEIIKKLNLEQSAALVFVRRRKDCHRISNDLNTYAADEKNGLTSLHALPFHAGLPENVKSESCDLLRERKTNVLVCTKAFGMGMDIPHLHVCIHHRPPTFIEDYLQEVGRIGRDEDLRFQTGHEQVTAALLYNQNDMERNLTQLHDKSIKPTDLQDFFSYCIEKAVFFNVVGKSLCIVPSKVIIGESKEFDEGQVTNCLFWLERMQVLTIEGRHPPFLEMSLYLSNLRRHSDGTSLASKIARLILSLVEESHDVVRNLSQNAVESDSAPNAEGIFRRVVRGILRGALALISPSVSINEEKKTSRSSRFHYSEHKEETIDASISMSELMAGCGDISMDDLFLGLYELKKAKALLLKKRFLVMKSSTPSNSEFWELLKVTVERLVSPTKGTVEYLNRKGLQQELQDWYRTFLRDAKVIDGADSENAKKSRLLNRRIHREVYRAINTALRLIRFAGLDVRETIGNDGVTQYARTVPKTIRSSVLGFASEATESMKTLINCVSQNDPQSAQSQSEPFEILLTDIMDALGPGIRIGRLQELMKLVETSGFYGFDGTLNDWVSLVSLNTNEALETHNPESTVPSGVQEVYNEMIEKFDLQVLRAQAMVLLASMPSENRKLYIDRYFECETADGIKSLLEDTVGDVDEEVINSSSMLQELLSQVRKERFQEEVEKLNENQRDVCKTPFDQTMLVNAGPGSGKTHVLMMRCAYLIHVQRIDPAEILVLAFNRAVVYEIRDRIRKLFRDLGYGSYTNKLDVSTFHSFSLRYQDATDLYEEDAIGQTVHLFAEEMKTNEAFAHRIGGKYKAILVDEFQDMNEDFYSVVRSLLTHCSGGGMVIGDDDQDILTWNRRKWRKQYRRDCPLDAVHYFNTFSETLGPKEHNLNLNYRSVSVIVKRANAMIENVSARVGFKRMKNGSALTSFRNDLGRVEELDPSSLSEIVANALDRGESVAVLCRSNRECRQEYEALADSGEISTHNIELLGAEDFALYQLRYPGALLDICNKRHDYEFVDTYIWDELLEEYDTHQFADSKNGRQFLELMYRLVREEVGRPRIRDLRAFIQEMRASDVERLKAKFGLTVESAKVTVATVHKVKGLEYDTVLLMPSSENFPFNSSNGTEVTPDKMDAAEEARLYYVAMTRAKNHLFFGWENREKAWLTCRKFATEEAAHHFCLKGSPNEVFVSWPGQEEQVQGGLQDYIGSQVCVGDPLSLHKTVLRHDGRNVGFLSNKTLSMLNKSNKNSKLCVANVIRYTCGRYFEERQPKFWANLDNSVKEQGWFYLVLAEETR